MRLGDCVQMAYAIAIWCVFCSAALASPGDGQRMAMIDAHALAARSADEASSASLARYLSQPTRDDTEKARAIFRWVVDRISYDVDAYFANQLVTMDAEDVLRQRRSICDGYAKLFEKLAREAGMEVVTINGYAKAYGHIPGTKFDRPNHAWNAIKIDGQWRMIDTTWGAGYVRNGKYVKALTESFFLAPPEQFMFSHFPLDDAWQLQVTPHLSKSEFERLPDMEPAFFQLGIAGENVWHELQSPYFSGDFVHTYDIPYHLAIVQQAPLSQRLVINQTLQFTIESGAFEQMAIVLNNQWTEMTKRDNIFTLHTAARTGGELLVVGKQPGTPTYTAILGYSVVP